MPRFEVQPAVDKIMANIDVFIHNLLQINVII